MARRFLFSQLKRRLMAQAKSDQIQPSRTKAVSGQRSSRGFTLTEVLVVALIGGGLVAGLMTIVVQLMQADQRESARAETQREMQLAMDYISTELREAVFVYTGEYMPTLAQYLPTTLSNSDTVPVIAFWRHQPFPNAVKTACVSSTPPAGVGCMSGQSYALVVYSLTRNPNPRPTNSVWRGGARITRYVLSQFQGNSTTITSGYVNPGDAENFAIWPLSKNGVNLQTARPTADARTIPTLVDFVDRQTETAINNPVRCPGDVANSTRKPYTVSPPDSMLDAAFGARLRSFYACVSSSEQNGAGANLQRTGRYQDVVLYLRGSAVGRPGMPNSLTARAAEVLPTLETRVMLRGVLAREPR